MSILERIGRIMRANVNWLLDKAEPPRQELESRIAELEQAIQEGRECAASYGATLKGMENQQQSLIAQRDQWGQRAAQALRAGDDATARQAVERKIHFANRSAALDEPIRQGRSVFEQLKSNLASLGDQARQTRLKLQELASREASAQAQQAFHRHVDKVAGLGGQGVSLDRLSEQVELAEARAQVAAELRDDGSGDFERRSLELQVEAELAELRRQAATPPPGGQPNA